MKRALTDIAFAMATEIWKEGASRGRLLFCIGGINAINPFSETAIKNEVLIFADLFSGELKSLPTVQGTVYGEDGEPVEFSPSEYQNIYMDFNGSLAFWDESWTNRMSDSSVAKKIRGVFVVGGVLTDQEPVTIPSIPKVLNRFSSATMNQLYHPQNAADFFAFLDQYKINTFVVTNNVVSDLTTFADDEKKVKTNQGLDKFLVANRLEGQFLKKAALVNYAAKSARKPYDFYSACALRLYMSEADKLSQDRDVQSIMKCCCKVAFYSNVYGITCVSSCDSWEAARTEYFLQVDRLLAASGEACDRGEIFRAEVEQIKAIDRACSLGVFELLFHLNKDSMELTVGCAI
jgi:hypothetical protein